MRQLVLDTETTGLDHKTGDRLIEFAAIELIDRRITGKNLHLYINPERDIDPGAQRVHGLSRAFLSDKPLFSSVVDQILEFIQDAELIIHNAEFDVGFLNNELKLLNRNQRISDFSKVIDTLPLARSLHPGQKNSLDALCKRYGIDNSHRTYHGALLDAELLAKVYLAMTTGQDSFFDNMPMESVETTQAGEILSHLSIEVGNIPVIKANETELELHKNYKTFLFQQSKIQRDW